MDYDNREKNPIFFPALIAALLLPAGVLCGDFGLWMLVTPFAALILSLVGLVISKKLQARFAGCVFCLVLSILELCFVAYMSKPISVPPAYTIQSHSLSPEESASIESVNEEINRALNEKPARRNEK